MKDLFTIAALSVCASFVIAANILMMAGLIDVATNAAVSTLFLAGAGAQLLRRFNQREDGTEPPAE